MINTKTIIIAMTGACLLATPVLAQQTAPSASATPAVESQSKPKREPLDLAKFSRMEALKSADTNGDGLLSREEIEAHALKMMVKRAADRMERRLDVNKDGKISLEAIEKARAERFAELDKNKDGLLDKTELKARGDHGKGKYHGQHHGKHHGQNHGKHHSKHHDKHSPEKQQTEQD